MCTKHHRRYVKHGDPHVARAPRAPDTDRFWKYVNIGDADDCWLWTGGINPNGYGYFNIRDNGAVTTRPAHRFMYEVIYGPIRDGLEIDHLCRVRACVNIGHLEAVTHAENVRRANLVTALHCPTCRCREC